MACDALQVSTNVYPLSRRKHTVDAKELRSGFGIDIAPLAVLELETVDDQVAWLRVMSENVRPTAATLCLAPCAGRSCGAEGVWCCRTFGRKRRCSRRRRRPRARSSWAAPTAAALLAAPQAVSHRSTRL